MGKYLKIIFRWLLAALAIYLFEFATGWVRAIDDYGIDIPIMFTKYCLLVIILIHKKKLSVRNACVLFTLTIGSIPIVAMIVDNVPPSSINAYINNGMGILGVWAGCVVMSKVRPGLKFIIPCLAILISAWYLSGGRDNYFNLLNGDTFTGKMAPANTDTTWKLEKIGATKEVVELNNQLITKYNLIKNIPHGKLVDEQIEVRRYYPIVTLEMNFSEEVKKKRKELDKKYK